VAAGLRRRRIGLRHTGVLALGAAIAVASCGIGASRSPVVTPPAVPQNPEESMTAAVASTRAEIVRVLSRVGLILDDPQVPYRPAEAPAVATAPRRIFQAVLPEDPGHGFIAVYELPDVPQAAAAAEEQARYVASGPGRVQFPFDTQFVVRRVGTTVVFHAYSRENATDPRAADVVVALQTLGDEVPVPR
jgi:hypothetical protein